MYLLVFNERAPGATATTVMSAGCFNSFCTSPRLRTQKRFFLIKKLRHIFYLKGANSLFLRNRRNIRKFCFILCNKRFPIGKGYRCSDVYCVYPGKGQGLYPKLSTPARPVSKLRAFKEALCVHLERVLFDPGCSSNPPQRKLKNT